MSANQLLSKYPKVGIALADAVELANVDVVWIDGPKGSVELVLVGALLELLGNGDSFAAVGPAVASDDADAAIIAPAVCSVC